MCVCLHTHTHTHTTPIILAGFYVKVSDVYDRLRAEGWQYPRVELDGIQG